MGFFTGDRYAIVTPDEEPTTGGHTGANASTTGNVVAVRTFYSNTRDLTDRTNTGFTVVVF